MGRLYSFPDYFILVMDYIHISFPLPPRDKPRKLIRVWEKAYLVIQITAMYVKESTNYTPSSINIHIVLVA
jgi:hypothetical protein